VRELEQVIGAGVRVCAASISTVGPFAAGMTTAIPGRRQPGSRRMWRSDAASGSCVPRGDDRLCVAVADGLHGAHEGRARLRADGLGGLLLQPITSSQTMSSTARIEPRGPQDGTILSAAAATAPSTISWPVAAERVDRDADRHARV
jgi:hypothetical protein